MFDYIVIDRTTGDAAFRGTIPGSGFFQQSVAVRVGHIARGDECLQAGWRKYRPVKKGKKKAFPVGSLRQKI